MSDPQDQLRSLTPTREFFIGIDSDGCCFDSMEIKHKECFCPATIKYFGLQSVSKYAREAWDFVNLYSKQRGVNRFPALIAVLDLLRERKEVQDRGAEIPQLPSLRKWISEETKLGNPALERRIAHDFDEELANVLAWSKAVNAAVLDIVYGVPPFPLVRESLKKAAERADMIVVSGTPLEALEREWEEHDLRQYVQMIAAQEHGSKKEHLALAAKGRYPSDRILMIGDAYGDLKAARANDALFYPVLPGREEWSWQRFYDEALDRFFAGTFAGAYQEGLMRELDEALPERAPWQ
ncbi:MAG TPA: HAD family hydrolase [Rhodothermales bacterium]